MDVAGAARRTLASGSARVWECRFSEPTAQRGSGAQFAVGIADLANVRLRVSETPHPAWDHLADLILERFPWLDDDDDHEDSNEGEPAVVVHAGTAAFFGGGDLWFAMGLDKGDPVAGRRRFGDPLWSLEALTNVGETAARSDEPELVRGDACRRWSFRVDLRSAGADLEARQERHMADYVMGDVWIDEDERVRRVTWRRPSTRRPRSLLKLLPATPAFTSWRTVELWDFGIDVDIEIPTPTPPEPGPSLREIYDGIGALWRRKRAYERRR